MKDEMLDLKASAKILGCGYGKAFRLAHSGKYSFSKIGNVWMIPKSKLYKELGLQFDDDEGSDALCA